MLKALAGNIRIEAHIKGFVFYGKESVMGKGENSGHQKAVEDFKSKFKAKKQAQKCQ